MSAFLSKKFDVSDLPRYRLSVLLSTGRVKWPVKLYVRFYVFLKNQKNVTFYVFLSLRTRFSNTAAKCIIVSFRRWLRQRRHHHVIRQAAEKLDRKETQISVYSSESMLDYDIMHSTATAITYTFTSLSPSDVLAHRKFSPRRIAIQYLVLWYRKRCRFFLYMYCVTLSPGRTEKPNTDWILKTTKFQNKPVTPWKQHFV